MWQSDGGNAGSLLNTYTTAKSVLPAAGGLPSIPANYMQLGTKFRFAFAGATSNRVTGPDTMTFQIMVNSGGIVACTSGAVNLTTTANTLASFTGEIMLNTTAIGNGTSAKFEGIWDLRGQSFAMAASLANNAGGTGFALGPLTSPGAGTGFDSTITESVDLWVAQSVSNAGNGIRIDWWTFESYN
jgi:hypothetical protein